MKIDENDLRRQAFQDRLAKSQVKRLEVLETELRQLKSKLNPIKKYQARKEAINKFLDNCDFTKKQRRLLLVLAGCQSINKTRLVSRFPKHRVDLKSLVLKTRKRIKDCESNHAVVIKTFRTKPTKYSLEFPTNPSLNW